MIVYVDLRGKEKRKFETLFKKLGVPVSSYEGEATFVISRRPHPYKPTVLVGDPKKEDITDNVIDIVPPDVGEKALSVRMKLYEVFLQTGDYYDVLEEEIYKSKRNTMPLSIVIFRVVDEDMDALRHLLRALSSSSRRSDKAFKLGDFEVMIILPGTDKAGAEVFARRLSRRVCRDYLRERISKKPNYVYGVAELEGWMVSADDLISSAEYNLLEKLR